MLERTHVTSYLPHVIGNVGEQFAAVRTHVEQVDAGLPILGVLSEQFTIIGSDYDETRDALDAVDELEAKVLEASSRVGFYPGSILVHFESADVGSHAKTGAKRFHHEGRVSQVLSSDSRTLQPEWAVGRYPIRHRSWKDPDLIINKGLEDPNLASMKGVITFDPGDLLYAPGGRGLHGHYHRSVPNNSEDTENRLFLCARFASQVSGARARRP